MVNSSYSVSLMLSKKPTLMVSGHFSFLFFLMFGYESQQACGRFHDDPVLYAFILWCDCCEAT